MATSDERGNAPVRRGAERADPPGGEGAVLVSGLSSGTELAWTTNT